MSEDRTEGLAALLLPCPFCGGEATLTKRAQLQDFWAVECCACPASVSPMDNTEVAAVEQWNRRVASRGVRLPGAAPPNTFLGMADAELARARAKHQGIKSRHEGYAVVLEELDEVKAEVWRDGPAADLLKELVQTAAMCARFAEDVGLVEAGAVPAAPSPKLGPIRCQKRGKP